MRPLHLLAILALTQTVALASDVDEFTVKRQEVFEFTEKPAVTRGGDKVTIAFTSKALCDATVAIENAEGRIIRHLACGVLGPKAPEPFQKDSLKQSVVWDGKNDKGEYVDDRDALTVRVSLGLKPQFERTLFWSPHKRMSESTPLVRAAPEGVYVYEGQALDHIRLFNHSGEYVRTVYPFPADKVGEVKGLAWHTFAPDGKALPLKGGYHQGGFLTSGSNNNPGSHEEGQAAFTMAVRGDRIALAYLKLNRLGTAGSSAGLPLEGAKTAFDLLLAERKSFPVGPWSADFSPDGKRLYLAGYAWTFWEVPTWDCLDAVTWMDFEKQAEPQVFAGSVKRRDTGDKPGQFHCATSVACDSQGRVYVSDYVNDRVQVFSPDGKFVQSVPVRKPAVVRVHQKTGEIFVFSWPVHNVEMTKANTWQQVKPVLTHLGPLENPREIAAYPLPLPVHGNWWGKHPPGPLYWGEIDSWADSPTVWISTVRGRAQDRGLGSGGDGFGNYGDWPDAGVKMLVPQGGKLVVKEDFGKEAVKAVVRATPPILWRQRLYVNPADGALFIAEGDSGVMKSVNQLVRVEPDTGRARLVDLPLGAEDLCFDQNGLAYLRTDTLVARYDPRTWREVPWDYGEERENHSYGMSARAANLTSALMTPGHRSFNFWHLGGIDVSVKGHIVVTTCNGANMPDRSVGLSGPKFGQSARKDIAPAAHPYVPPLYPGRMRWGEIHVFDEHGKPVCQDAVPGVGHLNGIGIDAEDGLYMLTASRRLIGGKPADPRLPRDASGTLVKVRAGKSKFLSSSAGVPVPLEESARPGRPIDIRGYTTGWAEGADWFYGGVGFCTPGACVCWNSRFDLDYFNRSFAPEPLRCSVAVLDSNGNLILRVGHYGNADDGMPLVRAGGPSNPRSMGGDEVALTYACYVAAHTDRRLFIADAGNARIVSVKLGYYAEDKVPLKEVPDQTQK